jgi:hypothetical protein
MLDPFAFADHVSQFCLRLVLDLAFNGLPAGLLGWWRYFLSVSIFHSFLEAFYGAAQITPEIAKFPGAEYQNNNYQNDQPVPDTE